MLKKVHQLVIIAAVLVTCTGGCKSTKDYSQLAETGKAYTIALDSLLVTAGSLGVDATSEKLLQDDVDRHQLNNGTVTLEEYLRQTNNDVKRLEVIEDLRTHTRLIGRYFSTLYALANSDAPNRAQDAVGGLVTNLNTVGLKLRVNPIVPNKNVFTLSTNLIVSSVIRGALREELIKRKDIIIVELKTQEELLKILSQQIKDDLEDIQELQQQRLIIDPLISTEPLQSQEEWITNRRTALTMQLSMSELKNASDTAKMLRETFEEVVEGKFNIVRINTLLDDIESIIAIAETFKK